MYSYLLSEEAVFDLEEIWLRIYELTKDSAFADKFIDSFFATFDKLSRNPGMGEARSYLVPGFRKWTHKKYMIYYTDQKEMIRIERILWGRRKQIIV